MKRLLLITVFSIAIQAAKAQTTCDSVSAEFSFTNSGVTYYFFDESILNNPDSINWHWNFDDGPNSVSSQRNPSHYFYYAGDHVVTLSIDVFVSGVWCYKSHSETITTVGVPAGIEEAKQTDVSIYPNPTTSTFKIESNLPIETYTLYDALGRTLLRQSYTGQLITLPSTISPGFYYLHVETANGIVVKRVELQR